MIFDTILSWLGITTSSADVTTDNQIITTDGSKMLRCYVAGPLNADACGYIKNMHSMIKAAREVRGLGIAVYVPCNDFLEGLVDGSFEYTDYFMNSQPWLEVSDFIFVCVNWESSDGTKKEIELARSLGKSIFYSIEDLKYALNHQSI